MKKQKILYITLLALASVNYTATTFADSRADSIDTPQTPQGESPPDNASEHLSNTQPSTNSNEERQLRPTHTPTETNVLQRYLRKKIIQDLFAIKCLNLIQYLNIIHYLYFTQNILPYLPDLPQTLRRPYSQQPGIQYNITLNGQTFTLTISEYERGRHNITPGCQTFTITISEHQDDAPNIQTLTIIVSPQPGGDNRQSLNILHNNTSIVESTIQNINDQIRETTIATLGGIIRSSSLADVASQAQPFHRSNPNTPNNIPEHTQNPLNEGLKDYLTTPGHANLCEKLPWLIASILVKTFIKRTKK